MKEEQSPENKHSYWLDTINLEPFEKLKQSTETDVGIVGGGITGLTAAYMLAKQNKKVTLIDADNLLHGTTGYTTAKITAQHGLIYDELIQHFGEDNASLYYKAAMEAKDIIENHISELNIDCDFKQEDAYIYTNDNKYVEKMKTEAKAYEKLGIPGSLADNMPLDIPHKAALVMHNQAQFHPLKYLAALIKACVDAGVAIYENTTATDVEYNKHPAIITKDGSRIRCRYVIIASHFPFYDGQGFYPTRLYAERAYVVGIKAKKKFPGGMYINAETPTRSVRSTGEQSDDLWLIVGENHKTGQGETMNNHYDALEQFADKNFGISEVLYRWSTQDLTTLDKVPYIGQITKSQHNVFVATGYRKWG
ncbi:FAD-binding oxidoreductase [Virgibacillus sp. 179-BFC.A HS]|uniref:FAD-binding oxidoreductase n=1 Tax=Tigheibacillus jepli TaxID=3035914 RepID=A0ABU5CIX5_9BACI|nr:FAD-binding oxidoreductase [Virgibacillus sp. 179-BFC.A HS]MDY0405764.1 FAD-binding oxidoreductase [Virgibacillus sp. 179-BFC.A HS]